MPKNNKSDLAYVNKPNADKVPVTICKPIVRNQTSVASVTKKGSVAAQEEVPKRVRSHTKKNKRGMGTVEHVGSVNTTMALPTEKSRIDDVARLERALSEHKTHNAILQQQVSALHAQISNQQNITNKANIAAKLERENSNLKHEVTEQRRMNNHMENKIIKLQQSIKSLQQTPNSDTKTISKLQKRVNDLTDDKRHSKELQAELDSLKAQNKKLEEKNAKANGVKPDEYNKLQRDFASLKKKLETVNADHDWLKQKHAELNDDFSQKSISLQVAKEVLDTCVEFADYHKDSSMVNSLKRTLHKICKA